LPVFRHYNIDDIIHSSSDGQKFQTQIHTIRSRHSPKYFGLKKGITNYTGVANHVPFNARIIGANESESHYIYDIMANNTTDMQPAAHSTDTHGTNEVNFVVLEGFGYSLRRDTAMFATRWTPSTASRTRVSTTRNSC
jgi:TnpA family transposase